MNLRGPGSLDTVHCRDVATHNVIHDFGSHDMLFIYS